MFVRLAFFPDATAAHFDRLAERMTGAPHPVGRLLFAAGQADGGWQVVQVWSSRAGLDEFNEEHFLPALRGLGEGAFPAAAVVQDFVPTSVDVGSLQVGQSDGCDDVAQAVTDLPHHGAPRV